MPGAAPMSLNPWFFSVFIFSIFFSFQSASLKRCPYTIIVLGCSENTRGMIQVNTRIKLKNWKHTEKLSKLKNQGFRYICMRGPPCPPESLVFQFVSVLSSSVFFLFFSCFFFLVSKALPCRDALIALGCSVGCQMRGILQMQTVGLQSVCCGRCRFW